MSNVTIEVNQEKAIEMQKFYQDDIVESKNEYLLFMARIDGCVINMYKSLKCVFQGDNAEYESSIWSEVVFNKQEEKKETVVNDNWANLDSHIGSDEVGTGDFFGPVVVCSCYVKKEDLPFIRKLNVQDSKKLTDAKIKEIAPLIMERFTYSVLVLDNENYNKQINKGENMNSIKAKLHNRALINVLNRISVKNPQIILDEFCSPANYYNYLKNSIDPVVKITTFHTKGETYAYGVAAASIIARYRFLMKMEEIAKNYNLGDFPKGASSLCDVFGQLFLKTYGLEELKKVSKCNFANLNKILNPLK